MHITGDEHHMQLHDLLQVLGRYLRTKTSRHQNKLIDQWYQDGVDDAQAIGLWEKTGKKEAVKAAIRQSIWAHIQQPPQKRGWLFPLPQQRRWLAAASLLAAIALISYWLIIPGRQEQGVQFVSVTAPLGSVKEIQLPDSSRVWLKSGSSLRYATTYGTERRELELVEGEAFFDVQQDPQRPFLVTTGKLQTKVLGTAFNIQAYADRPTIQVWVDHGRVAVSDSMQVLRELGKGQRLAWDRASGKVQLDSLVWEPALAWQQGVLLLQSASFTELAHQLKELYGVELTARNKHIQHLQFTAKFFIRTPVKDIVATLAAVHGLQFKHDGNIITLY
jgi:transmembrane sensor